jgi:hypothetical protein
VLIEIDRQFYTKHDYAAYGAFVVNNWDKLRPSTLIRGRGKGALLMRCNFERALRSFAEEHHYPLTVNMIFETDDDDLGMLVMMRWGGK